jgi:hypothetical protein
MNQQPSYVSRPYAPAWGILLGTLAGVPIDLAVQGAGAATGALSMLGLIIGTVIYYRGQPQTKHKTKSLADSPETRPQKLDRPRS